MKSVGEVMAIGRTFKEALLKGVRALDTGKRIGSEKIEPKILTQRLVTPHPERLSYIRYALRQGHTVKNLAKMTSIDPWFLYQLKEINDMQLELEKHPMESIPAEVLRDAKRMAHRKRSDICARRTNCRRFINASILAPPNSKASLPISTRPTRKKTRRRRPKRKKSSFSAAGRTGSGRGLNSIIAAVTPHSLSATTVTRPSW